MQTKKITKEKIQEMRNNLLAAENRREYWTKEEDQKLIKMYTEGVGITELACSLSRTERATFYRIQFHKLFTSTNQKSASSPKEECLCKNCTLKYSCANQAISNMEAKDKNVCQ